jgi:hypothetical protein
MIDRDPIATDWLPIGRGPDPDQLFEERGRESFSPREFHGRKTLWRLPQEENRHRAENAVRK